METPDFKRVFRGYDPEAVDQAWAETDRQLSEANASHKELRIQINSLREQNTEWGNLLRHYEQIEKDLRDALLSAQRIANQVKDEATKEANELRLSARNESETLVSEATRISESMEIDVETKLIEKRLESLQIDEQIKGLAEQKAGLQTQVDQALQYLELAKGVFQDKLVSFVNPSELVQSGPER